MIVHHLLHSGIISEFEMQVCNLVRGFAGWLIGMETLPSHIQRFVSQLLLAVNSEDNQAQFCHYHLTTGPIVR